MNPPTTRLTINEIAELVGVSKKTVSRFFNHPELLSAETRAKLEAVINQTGFVPNPQARALALQRSSLIVLVHDESDRGVLELVETAIGDALRGTELALVLQPITGRNSAGEMRAMLDRLRPMGVILLPARSDNQALVSACDHAQVRCIPLGQTREQQGMACDDRRAMAHLVTWLVKLGHRRIGLVSGPETSIIAQQRELGYLDSMADHGLDRGPSLIVPGDNTFDSGISAGRLLLEVSPRPTAVIACNDEMAAGVLHAAAHTGVSVPGQLSVVGFDDAPLATRTLPALTSMHIPWDRMAQEAVRRIASVEQAPVAGQRFDIELVLRDSVQPVTPS
jgi:Transcriptional regulators